MTALLFIAECNLTMLKVVSSHSPSTIFFQYFKAGQELSFSELSADNSDTLYKPVQTERSEAEFSKT